MYTYERIWFAVEGRGALGLSCCPWTLVGPFPWAQQGPFIWDLVGPFPDERSEACLEPSDEVCNCKLHMRQADDCTRRRPNPTHNTDKVLHIRQTRSGTYLSISQIISIICSDSICVVLLPTTDNIHMA